jgi:hypothetical protein
VQTAEQKGTATDEHDKKIPLDAPKNTETLAPAKTEYWSVKGNLIYALDSPGLKNAIMAANSPTRFVKSPAFSMHSESWVANSNGQRVSAIVKWNIKVTVANFEGKVTGGVEKP